MRALTSSRRSGRDRRAADRRGRRPGQRHRLPPALRGPPAGRLDLPGQREPDLLARPDTSAGPPSPTLCRSSSSSGSGRFTLATFNVLGSSHTARRRQGAVDGLGSERECAGVIRLLESTASTSSASRSSSARSTRRSARTPGGRTTSGRPGRQRERDRLATDRWSFVAGRALHVPYFNGATRRMPVVRLLDRVTGQTAVFVNVHNPADTRQVSPPRPLA